MLNGFEMSNFIDKMNATGALAERQPLLPQLLLVRAESTADLLPVLDAKHPHTGTAVSYLIRSIAKLADTSDKGTALISFLYTRS